jgi:hypothetical protein
VHDDYILNLSMDSFPSAIQTNINNLDALLDTYNFKPNPTKNDYLDLQSNYNTNLKIVHLNIRSLNKNFDELACFLSQLDFICDIVILTETQLKDFIPFNLPQYTFHYIPSNINNYDGIVVFIRNNVLHELKITHLELKHCNAASITFKILGKTFCITACYRSPKTNKHQFISELANTLSSYQNYTFSILIGDINIDILDSSETTIKTKYLSILNSLNYISLIHNITRQEGHSNSCLDHIFVKTTKLQCVSSAVLNTKITDHFPIMLEIDNCKYKDNSPQINLQVKKFIDYNTLQNALETEKWVSVLQSEDPNVALNSFTEILKTHIENCTRTSTRNIVPKFKPLKPWITFGIVKSIRTRDRMYKQLYRDNKLNYPNSVESVRFKAYRNLLNRIIKDAKIAYFQSQYKRAGKDSKMKWKVINEICDRVKPRPSVTKLVYDNMELTNPQSITDAFNKHFCSIGHKLAANIKSSNYASPHIFELGTNSQSIYVEPVSEIEIVFHINQLKINSSSGHDNISSNTLKKVNNFVSSPLSHIFNLSLEHGIFPDVLKKAVVTPIYKGGTDTININNYRPISVLPHIAKIFEKCLKKRIISFMSKYNLLSKNQFGFQEALSTEDALYKITSLLYKNIDDSKKTLAVFLDLKKAFDTVKHTILLEKLNKIGIRGTLYNLLKSYITNRTQVTKVDGTVSSQSIIDIGVPQGSVLGPILFLVYINDLCNIKCNGMDVISYADDTVLIFHSNNWHETFKLAKHGISIVHSWLSKNYLSLNIEKTKYLSFSANSKSLPPSNYHLCLQESSLLCDDNNCNNLKIAKSNIVKYLGIMIDERLNWSAHTCYLANKLRKCFYVYHRLKNILELKDLLVVFNSLSQSIIQYGIIGWGALADSFLKPVTLAQKHALKIILKKPYTYSSSSVYKETKMLDTRQLYIKNILNYYNKRSPQVIRDTQLSIPRYSLRNKKRSLLRLKRIGQRHADFIVTKLARILPENMKTPQNNYTFKRKTKSWLINKDRSFCSQIVNKNLWEILTKY